uniref:Ubiquitin-like domain-containing protein n=1 Tax=Panagrolaimus sp. ES5 TaxID=591445 RepID=A0AC34GTB0_9BILA
MSPIIFANAFKTVELTVMNENGNILRADVNLKNSVKNIRSKIQTICGIPLNRQCFTCFDDDKTFTNEFAQKDDEIVKNPFVAENIEEILYFTVKNKTGKSFMVKVDENELIENFMLRIQETCGISLNQQCFTCFDDRTLSDKFWENQYEKCYEEEERSENATTNMNSSHC